MAHSESSKSPMSIKRKSTARPLSSRRPGDENFLLIGQSSPGSHDGDAVEVAGAKKPGMGLGTILSIIAVGIALVALMKSK